MMKYSLIILLSSSLILLTNSLQVPTSSEVGSAVQDDSNEQGLIGENNEELEIFSNEDYVESIAKESLNVDISGENNEETLDEIKAHEALLKDSTDETLNENESDEKIGEDGIEENNGDDEVEIEFSKENIVKSTTNEDELVVDESETATNANELDKPASDDEIVKNDSQDSKEESTLLEDGTLKLRHGTEKPGTNIGSFDVADDLGEDNNFEGNTENDNNNDAGEDELENDDNESKGGLLISVKGNNSENSEDDDDDGEYVTEIVEFTEIVGGNYSGEVDVIKEDNVTYDQTESSYEISSSEIDTDKETKLVGTEVIIEETKLDDKDEKSTKKSGHHKPKTHSNDDSESAYSRNGSYKKDSRAGETKSNDSKNNKEKYKKWKDAYQYSLTKDFAFEGSSEPKALRQSLIIKNGGLPYRNLPDYIKQDLLNRMPPQNDLIQQLQNQFGNGARQSIDSINNALEQILTVKAGSFPKPAAWCCPNSMTLRGFTCQNGINKVPAQYFSHLTYFKFKDLICQTGRPPVELLSLLSGPIHQMMPEPGVMLEETPGAIQGMVSGFAPKTISASAPGYALESVMGTLSDATLDAVPINALGDFPGVAPGVAPGVVSGAVSRAAPVIDQLATPLLRQGGNPGPMSEGFIMGIQSWPIQGDLNQGILSTAPYSDPGGSLTGQRGPLSGAESRFGSGGIKLSTVGSPSSRFDPDLKIQNEILEGEVIPWPGDSDKLIDIISSINEISIPGNNVVSLGKTSHNNVTPNLRFGGMPITHNQGMMFPSPTNNLIPRIITDAMTGSGISMSSHEGLRHSSLTDSSRSGAIPSVNNFLHSGSRSAGMKVDGGGISSSSQVTRTNNVNPLTSQGSVSSANGNIKSGLGSTLNSRISSSLTNSMSADDRFLSQANLFNPGVGALPSINFNTQSGVSSNLKAGSEFASLTDHSMSGSGSPASMNWLSGMGTSSSVNKFPLGFESSLIHQQSNLIPDESLTWSGWHSDGRQFAGSLPYRDGEEEWVKDTFDSQELLDHQSMDWIDEDLDTKDYAWVPNDEHHIYDNLIQDDSHPKHNEQNNLIVPDDPVDYTLQDGILLKIPEGLQADMLTNPLIENNYLSQDLNQNIFTENLDSQNATGQKQLGQNPGIQQQLINDMTEQSLQMDNSFIASNFIDPQGQYDPLMETWNSDTYSKYREGKSLDLSVSSISQREGKSRKLFGDMHKTESGSIHIVS